MSRLPTDLRPVLLAWAILTVTGISSCTLAPAKLRRVAANPRAFPLEQVLRSPRGISECYQTIQTTPDSPYGLKALETLLTEGRKQLSSTPGRRSVSLAPGFELTFAPGSGTVYSHDYFEELIPASSVQVTRLKHHRREGTGLPLIGRRENTGREAIETYYPPEAITRPVTAVGEVKSGRDGSRHLTITLYSPLCQDTILVHGRRQPLAADITASWVALLERAGKLRSTGLTGFLRKNTGRKPQLYLMEPYDPRREPLILVHGLLSTPLTWASVTNELWADPSIRRRYQIWHYHYPTSSPFLYSASVFRRQLEETLRILRGQGHRTGQPITIIAHSMGGLISKTLITDSGEKIWDTIMAIPPGQVKGSPAGPCRS